MSKTEQKTIQQHFSERLRECMTCKCINTVDIERATGISHNAISMWLYGKRKPQIDALCLLADYFDCTVDFLLGRKDY